MLGRKQSLKGEPILADYGPEESLNESADIEWVNKVRKENVAGKLRYSIAGNDNIGRNFFFSYILLYTPRCSYKKKAINFNFLNYIFSYGYVD